jgi:hypothetical protein
MPVRDKAMTIVWGVIGLLCAAPGPTQLTVDDSNFGIITLTTGFMPDPRVTEGRSGGALDVSALTTDTSCRGWIDANKPDHLFVAKTEFGLNFRILATSLRDPQVDITLVVQRPDGTYVCNDDAAPPATDPIIGHQRWMRGV